MLRPHGVGWPVLLRERADLCGRGGWKQILNHMTVSVRKRVKNVNPEGKCQLITELGVQEH